MIIDDDGNDGDDDDDDDGGDDDASGDVDIQGDCDEVYDYVHCCYFIHCILRIINWTWFILLPTYMLIINSVQVNLSDLMRTKWSFMKNNKLKLMDDIHGFSKTVSISNLSF